MFKLGNGQTFDIGVVKDPNRLGEYKKKRFSEIDAEIEVQKERLHNLYVSGNPDDQLKMNREVLSMPSESLIYKEINNKRYSHE